MKLTSGRYEKRETDMNGTIARYVKTETDMNRV